MPKFRKILMALAASSQLAGPALALAADGDPLRSALEDSKASGKGLTIFVNGVSVPGVIVSIGEKYVTARSVAQGNIVIRLDRIDGVAGFPGERKTQ